MSEWTEIKLGDLVARGVAEIRTGPFGTQLRASDYSSEGVPVINVRNLGYGTVRTAEIERVGFDVQERLRGHLLVEGDVVFGRKGAVDRHILVTQKEAGWMQGSDCIRVRLLEGSPISPAFLSKALLTPSHKVWMEAQGSHGATMASLNQAIIGRISVSAPEPPRQHRIAAVLSAFDELIEINERRIELLEDLARSLYREWFVRFRFPRHAEVDFMDSELGSAPAEWAVRRLGDVASLNKRIFRATDLPDPLRYLDISSVGVGRLNEPTVIDAARAPGRARRSLHDGDVLWATVRPNRRAHGLVHDPPPDLVASTGLAAMSPESVPASFLFLHVSEPAFTEYLVSRTTGSAYPAVRPIDFEEAPIVVPSAPILDAFDQVAAPSLRLASALVEQNRSLARGRDLLLPRLVTGRLDIADIDLGELLPAEAT